MVLILTRGGDFIMSETYVSNAPQTLDGWYVLHDFRTIDWAAWKAQTPADRTAAVMEFETLYGQFDAVNANRSGSFGTFAMVGGKADLLFLHMAPTVEELVAQKTKFNKTRLADFTRVPYSYFSIVELGSYLARGKDPEVDEYVQSRLKPEVPNMKHVCFYPMNKKRDSADNWYTLPSTERTDYLRNHGMIGRQYAGVVKQIISGSTGLDDWEWGVTLFSDDALQFKKLVAEMRFEEGSARFGDFGPFYVGYRLLLKDALDLMQV